MPRGSHHPSELVAEAIRRHFAGESLAVISRAIGVPKPTIGWWINRNDPIKKLDVDERHYNAGRRTRLRRSAPSDPVPPSRYQRDQAELGAMVYDCVMATLDSIRARAVETSRPQWIRKQSADQLAALAASEWPQIIRLVSAFRPAAGGVEAEGEGDEAGAEAGQRDEPEVHRNGTLGTAT